jgi:O-antigen/teichoic acid export membrane protein
VADSVPHSPVPPVRRRLADGALAVVAAQVTVLAANAILSVAIARILEPSGTGHYGVAVTVFALLAPVTTIGLRAGVMYLVSRGEWPAGRALRECQAAALVLGLAAAAVAVSVYALWRDGPLHGLGGGLVALTLMAVAAWVAWTLAASILLAHERYEAFGLTQIVQALTGLAVSVGLMVPFGVVGAVGGLAASQFVAAAFANSRVLALPGAGAGAQAAGRLTELRRAAAFGSKTWLAEIFWALNFRLDVLILNAYAASATVGVYFVAGSLGALAWVLPSALQTVILPRVAALDAAAERGEGGLDDSDATAARAMRHGVLLALPTGLGLAVLLAIGVPLLYGAAFHKAVLYGFLLLPGVLAGGIGRVASGVLNGRGRPGYVLLPMLLVTPPTIAAYLLVIPAHGAIGAALVSSISYAAVSAVACFLLIRVTKIPAAAMLVPRQSDVRDYGELIRGLRDRVSK